MTTAAAPSAARGEPTRLGYWLSGLAVILGLSVAAAYAAAGVLTAASASNSFDRTIMGGSLTAGVEEAGRVVVYVEADPAPALAELQLTVTDSSGNAVVVEPYGATVKYDRDAALGVAVGSFDAPIAGNYQIDSAAPDSATIIAVGPDIAGVVTTALGRAGLILGASLLAAAVLAGANWVLNRP